jgi:L-alanine-DL-glutamate epimerase-like enolase superfamily enzyme
MRIATVRARVLEAAPSRGVVFGIGVFKAFTCVLVEVTTEDGLVGYGEAIARRGAAMTKAAVEDLLAEVVVGEDPRNIERIWVRMHDRLRRWGHSGGVVLEAMSGVDTALWDLIGKAEGQPIAQLLHGYGRTEIPVYASSVYIDEPDVMVAQTQEQVAAGFAAVKIKIGRSADKPGVDADVAVLQAIREAVGESVELLVDANGAYDAATALRLCARVEHLDLAFLEEPLPPDDLDGYARLHAMTTVPLARGETDFGIFDFNRLLTRRLIDVVQPDVARCGGITGARHTYTLAFAHNVAFAPHTGFSGGVSQLAALHVAAAAPSLWRLEHMFIDNPLRDLFLQPFPDATDGVVTVPSAPGLGLDLDLEKVDRLTVA